ncbi:hypothetical protein BN1723_016050, partial [Verticillium longisporum]
TNALRRKIFVIIIPTPYFSRYYPIRIPGLDDNKDERAISAHIITMRSPFRRRPSARRPRSPTPAALFAMAAAAPYLVSALEFREVPESNLDLSQLGRIGLAGNFDGISLYEFEGQNELPLSTNGSEALLARLPNGAFASIASTDASIHDMCASLLDSGEMAGVVIAGNFTSVDGTPSQGVALFNTTSSQFVPLDGLSGQVNALLCDEKNNMVYAGGNFRHANSTTNAIAWVHGQGWTPLPFAGFNGPVSSITKASNDHIIFGGSFTGLGNTSTPTTPDGQIINLSGANVTAASSSRTTGFSDPRNILCKTEGAGGAGNSWLLEDGSPGFWRAQFSFGFEPTKLRLWNTRQDGRGTRTWRFTAFPINGILNMTYVDPATGQNATCTSECPLSNDPAVTFQDFHFINNVGMDEFRIDISEFYGAGGGLNGIQLFGEDIFAYAINDFNEPTCEGLGIQTPSTATATGPWTESPSLQSNSRYLTAQFSADNISDSSAAVVFFPNIEESGNYSVEMYTPGCIQDDTCTSRGQVNVTGDMSSAVEPVRQPRREDSEITNAMVDAPELGKRFQRAAVPRAPQANPFDIVEGETAGAMGKKSSAFTQLMSGHAESAAWANAAAADKASRGKAAYERTCPFYKIMPGFNICVDAFRYGAVKGCQAYFLSHFHSDHYIGLTAHWTHGPIYCSKVTGDLCIMQLKVAPKWIVALDFEETVEVPGTGGVMVTMIPANHCPGSSLFLFEKPHGKGANVKKQRYLHCGDFRACPAHVEHPLLKPDVQDAITGKLKQQRIDLCYLDTTYLNPRYSFPPQEDVIRTCA